MSKVFQNIKQVFYQRLMVQRDYTVEKRHKKLFGNSTAGVTLVEMLVVVGIFLILGGAVLNLLFSAIVLQRNTLDRQETVNQLSFVAEYMSRAIRESEKDLVDACLTTGTHLNYEVQGGVLLRFLDKDNKCREFSFDSSTNAIQERRSTNNTVGSLGLPIPLTPDNIEVSDMQFFIQGEQQPPGNTEQPRVTFFIDAENLKLQTTISQRRFDVEEL